MTHLTSCLCCADQRCYSNRFWMLWISGALHHQLPGASWLPMRVAASGRRGQCPILETDGRPWHGMLPLTYLACRSNVLPPFSPYPQYSNIESLRCQRLGQTAAPLLFEALHRYSIHSLSRIRSHRLSTYTAYRRWTALAHRASRSPLESAASHHAA